MYPGTRRHGKLPRTANASVTAGLRWAPEIVPMKKMIPMTIMPGARAFIARVRSPPMGRAPITPPPPATSTSRNVPQTSLNRRRSSRLESSKSISPWRDRSERRVNQARTGSPLFVAAVM